MNSDPVLRRVVRRETHSSRTVATIVVVMFVIAALIWVSVELVLALASLPPLLVGPSAVTAWLAALPSAPPAVLALGGLLVALMGVVSVGLAVMPGRLPKHPLTAGERAVVVDNGVTASALARTLSEGAGVDRDHVSVGVGHRVVDVRIRPDAAEDVDRDEVRRLVDAAIEEYGFDATMSTRVRIEPVKEVRVR